MEKKLKNYVCFVDPTSTTSGAASVSATKEVSPTSLTATVAVTAMLKSATAKAQSIAKQIGSQNFEEPAITRAWSYDPNQKSDLFSKIRGE